MMNMAGSQTSEKNLSSSNSSDKSGSLIKDQELLDKTDQGTVDEIEEGIMNISVTHDRR